MTKNKADQDSKACEVVNGFAKCKSKHPKPQKIILECGEGTGSRTFTSANDMPFQIAQVRVDTTCLNKSKVLIKFSSIRTTETFDFTYCDCAACPGGCDYFVTVRPVELYLTTNFEHATTTVSNGRMAALAQEG